jgi:O-antigen/teichoic acid export membrane protein
MTDIKSKAKSGMLWSFMIQGGTQVINFVVTIILSRLLMPEQSSRNYNKRQGK